MYEHIPWKRSYMYYMLSFFIIVILYIVFFLHWNHAPHMSHYEHSRGKHKYYNCANKSSSHTLFELCTVGASSEACFRIVWRNRSKYIFKIYYTNINHCSCIVPVDNSMGGFETAMDNTYYKNFSLIYWTTIRNKYN